MAGKRFRSSLFGFDKASVNTYIENLTRDYEERITSKDIEIEKMMNQLKTINGKYEAIKLEEERIYTEKEKISKALVSANDQADRIIEDAKDKVVAEVYELEQKAESEREKIVDIKSELMKMKSDASDILARCKTAIDSIILDDGQTVKVENHPDGEHIEEKHDGQNNPFG